MAPPFSKALFVLLVIGALEFEGAIVSLSLTVEENRSSFYLGLIRTKT
jgi:hypothetical protein